MKKYNATNQCIICSVARVWIPDSQKRDSFEPVLFVTEPESFTATIQCLIKFIEIN